MSTTRPEEALNESINSTLRNTKNILLTIPWQVTNNQPSHTYQNAQNRSFVLPKDIFDMINNIDAAINSNNRADKISVFPQISAVSTLAGQEQRTLKIATDYLDEVAQSKAETVSKNILDLIEMNINEMQEKIKTAKIGQNVDADQNYITELEAIRTSVNTTMNKMMAEGGKFQDLTGLINDAFLPLMTKMEEKAKSDGKFERFYEKKIAPYLKALLNPNQNQEIIVDFEFVMKKIMREADQVTCLTFETETGPEMIAIIDDKPINLTKIFAHQPDINALDFDESDYDKYYQSRQDPTAILAPVNFPVRDFASLNPTQCRSALENAIPEHFHIYEKCHVGTLLAMNIYTTGAFALINKMLREKILKRDIFENLILKPNKSVTDKALLGLERRLRGANTGDPLTDQEFDRLAKEILVSAVMIAMGMKNSEHVDYHADIALQLDIKGDWAGGRFIRGSSGPYVPLYKNLVKMAYQGRTPLIEEGVMSASIKVSTANDFMENSQNAMLTKLNTIKMNGKGIGTYFAPISSFRNEEETALPLFCTILAIPSSPIKYPEHYKNPSEKEKVSLVAVDISGGGPMSLYYSSAIQELRCELIMLRNDPILKTALNDRTNTDASLIFESLNAGIAETDSLFKNIKIYVAKDQNSLPVLPDGVDAAYVFTADKKIIFLDKENNTPKNLPLKDNFDEIASTFMVSQEVIDIAAGGNKLMGKANINNVNYLEEKTDNPDFKKNHTLEQSLAKLGTRMSKLRTMCEKNTVQYASFGEKILKIDYQVNRLNTIYNKPSQSKKRAAQLDTSLRK